MSQLSGSSPQKLAASCTERFRHNEDIPTSHAMRNLAAVLESLADLCAVIQSDIGSTAKEIPEIPDSLISHLQNIDRLQQNLEDLSKFHTVYSTLCDSGTLSYNEQELLGKYMVLSSLKSRIFPLFAEESASNKSGNFDQF